MTTESIETPTPTPETPATLTALDAARKAVTEATAALDAANAVADKAVAAIMAVKPINHAALGKAAEPVEAAQRHLDSAKDALKVEETKGFWDKAEEVRAPVRDSLRDLLITNAPSAAITSVSGLITINDEGDAHIVLMPVVSKPDMSEIEAMIATTINGPAFAEQGITSIDVNVTGIGKADAMVNLIPTAAVTAAARVKVSSEQAARSGAKVYTYKGVAYGAGGFLEALEAEGHEIAKERAQAFNTVLRVPPFNGRSNLAGAIAPKVGATISEAKPAETKPVA